MIPLIPVKENLFLSQEYCSYHRNVFSVTEMLFLFLIHMLMGVNAPGSAPNRPSARPPIGKQNFFGAHDWGGHPQKNIEHFLISFIAISVNSKHFVLIF